MPGVLFFNPQLINAEQIWKEGDKPGAINGMFKLHNDLIKFLANLVWDYGNEMYQSGKIDDAIKIYEKGLKIYAEDESIQLSLHNAFKEKARIAINKGQYGEAKKILKNGLKYKRNCESCRSLLQQVDAAIRNQSKQGKKHRHSPYHKRK